MSKNYNDTPWPSASTMNAAMAFLIESEQVKELIRANSSAKHRNEADQSDLLAELISYTWGRWRSNERAFLDRFNDRELPFRSWVCNAIKFQSQSDRSAFACKYDQRQASLESDDQAWTSPFAFEFSASTVSRILSGQEPDLIYHLLRSESCVRSHPEQHRAVYKSFLQRTLKDLKRPKIAALARDLDLDEKLVRRAVVNVGSWLKQQLRS